MTEDTKAGVISVLFSIVKPFFLINFQIIPLQNVGIIITFVAHAFCKIFFKIYSHFCKAKKRRERQQSKKK